MPREKDDKRPKLVVKDWGEQGEGEDPFVRNKQSGKWQAIINDCTAPHYGRFVEGRDYKRGDTFAANLYKAGGKLGYKTNVAHKQEGSEKVIYVRFLKKT